MRARLACVAMMVVLAAVAAAAPARAHATLIASEPADGAVIRAPPAQFTLTFNEPVAALALRLIGPDSRAAVLAPTGRGTSLVIAAPAGLREGTHALSFRVVSLDGHPVGGTVVFSIGAPTAAPDLAAAADAAVAAALWACRLVIYLGLFVGVGGSFFRAWLASGRDSLVSPDPSSAQARRRSSGEEAGGHPGLGESAGSRLSQWRAEGAMTGATLAGLAATPVAVGLQGADALGVPLSGLASQAVWQAGLETSFGLTAMAAAFALFAGLFALRATRRVARGLALLALLAAGLALALSGHASAAAPQWLTRPAVGIHALAVAFWIGSLAPLAAALRGGTGALTAFSRAIPWAILALIVSGAALAAIQVEQPELLLSTAYGRLLCGKLALVALLLLVAARNRFRLTPAAGRDAARRALRRMIAVELALVMAILGLVAAWRFTPPPRVLAIAAAQPALVHIHTAQAMADVSVQPGRAGLARVEIILMNGDFGGLDAREVQLTFANAAAGIEPIVRPARKGADGVWRAEQFPIPQGGRWDVRLDILVNDFERIQLSGELEVGR